MTRVISPNFLPITLDTFVAPRFPLPSLVRSEIPFILAIIADVGKLTARYAANI